MKLKYYMRGLGIGIILTTLILTISGKYNKPSNQEIIRLARELGMVPADEVEDGLTEVLNGMEPTKGAQKDDNQAVDAQTEGSQTDGSQTDGSQVGDDKTEGSKTEINQSEEDQTVGNPDEGTQSGDSQTNGNDIITFTISKGMSSGKVSELLVQKGLIEDAKDFNNYVIEKGKAGVIRIGTYEIKKGATFDEIINAITG